MLRPLMDLIAGRKELSLERRVRRVEKRVAENDARILALELRAKVKAREGLDAAP
jgi:hypothetical protein